jgi:hypothetical protein
MLAHAQSYRLNGRVVGVFLERGIDTIYSCLAIMSRCGLPALDLSYNRTVGMDDRIGSSIILTENKYLNRLPSLW